MALGGGFRGASLSEESGSCRRPGSSLVAVAWATVVRREPASEEVVRRRIREEDDHVRRYMAALDAGYYSLWQVLQGSHPSYEWVMVPSLWVSTKRRNHHP